MPIQCTKAPDLRAIVHAYRRPSEHGQGNPFGARITATLTGPAVSASWQNARRRSAMCIVILCGFLALSAPSKAEQITQSLQVEQLSLDNPSPLEILWSDEISDAVKRQDQLRKTVPSVKPITEVAALVTKFNIPTGNIIVSTIDIRGSSSCSGNSDLPVGTVNNSINCITRIAKEDRNGKLEPIYSGIVCSARDFDSNTGKIRVSANALTSVTIDTVSKTISIKGLQNNQAICVNAPIRYE